MFCKKGVLRNFAKFTGKHLCQSLFFNKVAGRSPAILLKKRLWHRCFPVNFVKFLRTPFLTEHLRWLLLYQEKLNDDNLDWKNIYFLLRIVTKDSKLRAFQSELLNNVFYLNKMLFKFGKIGSSLCCLCNLKDEIPYYLLYECSHMIYLFNLLRYFLSYSLNSLNVKDATI